MISETMQGVICISHIRDSVLSEKAGEDIPDESPVSLIDNLR